MNYVDVPYLFLDFSQILGADAHTIFFSRQKFSLNPLTALLGHPVQKQFFIFFIFFNKPYLKSIYEEMVEK